MTSKNEKPLQTFICRDFQGATSHKKKTLPFGDVISVPQRTAYKKKTLPFGDVISRSDFSQKKTLPIGDVFLLGCPVGLEPTTFRTTI